MSEIVLKPGKPRPLWITEIYFNGYWFPHNFWANNPTGELGHVPGMRVREATYTPGAIIAEGPKL